MNKYLILLLSVLTVTSTEAFAQGYLKTEYMTSSSFENKEGEKFGSGNLQKISGRYTLPISFKKNDLNQPTLWSASIVGTYSMLNNKGEATNFNPDEVLNTSINILHVRPISKKWLMMATLGGGIYSAPDAITFKSILVNGGVIFLRKVNQNLDLGIGLGLTNSYGLPIVMPMSIINWRFSRKYEVKVDIASRIEISGAVKFNDKLKFRLIAMEMDGMSAVINNNGQSLIYATTIMKSWLCLDYKIGKSSTLYLGAGSTWMRSVSLSKRSLKDFFNNLFHDENKHLGFSSAGYFTVGYRFSF